MHRGTSHAKRHGQTSLPIISLRFIFIHFIYTQFYKAGNFCKGKTTMEAVFPVCLKACSFLFCIPADNFLSELLSLRLFAEY